jgi:hypothetical protein
MTPTCPATAPTSRRSPTSPETSTCARRSTPAPGTARVGGDRRGPRLRAAARRGAGPPTRRPRVGHGRPARPAWPPSWLRMRETRPAVTDRQASTQADRDRADDQRQPCAGELWRVTVDPTTLETGACYEDETAAAWSRAFYPDTAPGYFGDGWAGPPPRAESRCGWETPLVLHLGTFPWVYSSRLDAGGRGCAGSRRRLAPAVEGFASWPPAFSPRPTSSRTRARSSHLPPFRGADGPADRPPPDATGSAAAVGQLYQRAGFLHVHQGSLHVAGLDGPRGRLPALGLQPHRPALRRLLRRPAGDAARPGVGPRDEAPRGQHQRPVPARPGRGGGPCWLNTVLPARRAVPRRPMMGACATAPSSPSPCSAWPLPLVRRRGAHPSPGRDREGVGGVFCGTANSCLSCVIRRSFVPGMASARRPAPRSMTARSSRASRMSAAMEDKTICEPRCNEVKDCPETNGVALICHQGYCIGEIGGS